MRKASHSKCDCRREMEQVCSRSQTSGLGVEQWSAPRRRGVARPGGAAWRRLPVARGCQHAGSGRKAA